MGLRGLPVRPLLLMGEEGMGGGGQAIEGVSK